jgi:hypothetical protein
MSVLMLVTIGGLQLDKDLRCIMGFFPTRR